MNLDSITMNNLKGFVGQLERNMHLALDKNAPEMSKNIVARKKVPWFTDEIRAQIRIVRRREKIWQKYRQDHQWTALKYEWRKYKNMLATSKKEVISEKVLQCHRDT